MRYQQNEGTFVGTSQNPKTRYQHRGKHGTDKYIHSTSKLRTDEKIPPR